MQTFGLSWIFIHSSVCVSLTEPRETRFDNRLNYCTKFLKVSVLLLAGGGRSLAAAAALGQEHMDASERNRMTKPRRVWNAGEQRGAFFFFFPSPLGQRETVDRTDSASLRATRAPLASPRKKFKHRFTFVFFSCGHRPGQRLLSLLHLL